MVETQTFNLQKTFKTRGVNPIIKLLITFMWTSISYVLHHYQILVPPIKYRAHVVRSGHIIILVLFSSPKMKITA